MTFDDAFKYNKELLDRLDLAPYIHAWEDPRDIMTAIEDAYADHEFPEEIDEVVEDDPLDGFIFNYFSTEDFMDYLHERYGTNFNSEIRY